MKRTLITLAVIAILIALAACGSSGKGPEAVAKSFLSALESKDFEAAKKLATEDSAGMLTLVEGFMQEDDKTQNNRFSVVSVEEEGDSATVTMEAWNSETPDKKDTDTLNMVKENGDWKVKLEKD